MSHKNHKLKITSCLAALVLAASLLLTGCSFGIRVSVSSVSFTADSIDMKVGEEVDGAKFVVVGPSLATDKSFTLKSGDESVFTVSATQRIQAIGVGSASLTATTNDGKLTANCTVNVTYKDLSAVTLTQSGALIQDYDGVEKVEFTATVSDGGNPNPTFRWYVNDVLQPDAAGSEFVFTPESNKAAQYAVKVTAEDNGVTVSAESVVRVYRPFVVAPEAVVADDAILVQEDGAYSNVDFSLSYENHPENPDPVVAWTINGDNQGGGKSFVFRPSKAGRYEIAVTVNGKPVPFADGTYSREVTAKGKITPENVTVDMDNCYPDIMIRWDEIEADMHFQISIVNNSDPGDPVNINDNIRSDNTALTDLFDGSSFNAKNFMTVTNSYTVKVKSLGDGDVYTPSDYTAPVTTARVDSAAIPYLEKTYYNGNYYMTDDDEFADVFAYTMLFRNSRTLTSYDKTNKMTVYMAYSSARTANPDVLRDYAFDLAGFTGSYYIDVTRSGGNKIWTVEFTYETVNVPTQTSGQTQLMGLNALRPHVNYDETKYRSANYIFPIDRLKAVTNIVTTEELYYVAQQGYRPVPKIGSDAATVYNRARSVLSRICTDDMTVEEKAHAIYDWIMWRVNYDDGALEYEDIADAVKQSAYYLEGVFGRTVSFAVCDGISKAYSLMCNIEGIPCIRIAGTAYTGGSWGGHAWNKVKLSDGQWYIVDGTWGDSLIQAGNTVGEGALHEYLFLTDAEVAADHKEDTTADGTNHYPRTATVPFNWYNQKFDYEGKSMDFYLNSAGDELNAECTALIDYLVGTKGSGNSFQVPDLVSDTTSTSNYYGIDVMVSNSIAFTTLSKLTAADAKTNPLVAALNKAGYKNESGPFGTHSFEILNYQGSNLLIILIRI